MKAFRLGRHVGGGALVSGNVSVLRKRNVPAICHAQVFQMPRQSSFREPPKTTRWTQYSLDEFAPPLTENYALPESSKKTPTVHTAYIALGSNLGDRIGWIESACKLMSARHDIKIRRTSCLWETEPMYVTDQGSFVNGVCEVETILAPLKLLDMLQSIETQLGREKIIDKGPRNIDLDILLYDDQVVDHKRLNIPHQAMFEREFVLRPLAELIPGKSLDPASPWKVTQDYLNSLPPSPPISTLTPLHNQMQPIRALQPTRNTRVMAIMNLTPDSFSDGGDLLSQPTATLYNRAFGFQNDGATIIDIGGQSTAPGTEQVSDSKEISRITGFLQHLNERRQLREKVVISVDTYRSSVAAAAAEVGIDIINDISAGQMDPDMLPTMARLGKTVILMHTRGTPETMNKLTDYPDGLIPTIAKELLERVAAAEAAGIYRWRIILDPGIGFAKTSAQNLEILRRFEELREWPGLRGLPWLVGSSRKNFIGKITGAKEVAERIWGTAATVAAAVQAGADIVRVHDVQEMAKVAKMSDAIWRV